MRITISKYSPQQRQQAVDLAMSIGVTATSAKLGIPYGTINNWAFVARKNAALGTTQSVPKPKAASSSTLGAQIKKPRRVARSYTPSEKARALELAAEIGVTAVSKQLGMSRFSLYEWQRKVRLAAAGKGDSPTSGAAPDDIEAQRDKEILALWRQHPGLGPSQVRNQLRRKGVKVGVNTVRRVMEDAGYRPPKVKRDPHDSCFEAVRPNHMWHLDFVHRHINRTNTFTLILIDDHSRYVVGHGVDDAERADMVVQTFTDAVQRHGRPEAVMNDKGSAFWSWKGISRFTSLLTELGVDQIIAEHKEWNGKVEVFNSNLAKELFDVQRFYDISEMKRRLESHMHWYNHRRTHHALGGLLVPADRYYGRVDEVLSRIEAGVGASSHTDMLDLHERALELFKVVSRGGKPEIWLLGQPLLTLGAK
ncbi:MAG: DDE-type integrase/transposase/recombinase [Gammaproteobacteria bacterium]|nr:DDE-type integrase/transposase/recombinase [Gammaproteobacteria bacterium]